MESKMKNIPAYQNVEEAAAALRELEGKLSAIGHAMSLISVDAETVAPAASAEGRGHTLGVLSGMEYAIISDPANAELLSYLESAVPEEDIVLRRETEMMRKSVDRISRIPAEEYIAYVQMINDAQNVWHAAKSADDFSTFAPYLEKIVAYNQKFASYYNPNIPAYDALLNEYEEGMTMETLDAFFAALREDIVPLLAKVCAAEPIDDAFLHRTYPVEIQRVFSDYLMETMGIDRSRCVIGETEHPFTANFNNKDVRITTHYYDDHLGSSMYSVIHEGGHALYELGCADAYNHTVLSGGVSMGIHESQSRFYENCIGRSREFILHVFPKIKELFPEQLSDVDAEQFYRAVNAAAPSLIRTEADELTYALHIMVRYELEKQLISGTLSVQDVPAAWNALYKEYLGIDVPNDREGCLQDTHWSGGMIGYFPSYALGSAYAAQMLHCMENEMPDFWDRIAAGDLSAATEWLREHIHQHACLYRPGKLFTDACGTFDASHYSAYLRKKFSALYGLSED